MQYLHAQKIQFVQNESFCDCKNIMDCASLKTLLDNRDFAMLKAHKSCGFDGKVLKYCCPDGQVGEPNQQPISISGISQTETYFKNLDQVCGTQYLSAVVGGKIARDHEYPWLAALAYGEESIRCGGVLVSHNVIVTAAHCINDQLSKVKLGHANLNNTEDFDIDTILVHPEFDAKSVSNDLALIKINSKLIFDSNIKPICLPKIEHMKDEPLKLAGWDVTNQSKYSNVLLHLNLDFVEQGVCEDLYRGATKITPSQICANYLPKEDLCEVTSGPLMQSQNQQIILMGFSSFGPRLCNNIVPDVYTNILHHIEWIRDFILANSSK